MTPEPPTVSCSVVVPVRDDAEHLRALLPLLRNQTVIPTEIIVVDNASSDATAEVAFAAGCRVITELRVGIPAAAAAGYDAAVGEVIARCDADSRPGPRWIERHLRALDRGGPGTVAVTGPARFDLPPVLREATSAVYLTSYNVASFAALGHVPLFGTNVALRRCWWQDVRTLVATTPEVHDDMDLSFQVRPGERVAYDVRNVVGMADRALRPSHNAGARLRRGITTVRRAWQQQRPWERWQDRLRG